MSGIVAAQCPRCDGELLPILWGMPTLEDWEAGQRGEVYIGGCIVPDAPWPRWTCAACGIRITDDGAEEPADA